MVSEAPTTYDHYPEMGRKACLHSGAGLMARHFKGETREI